jgi:DNA-binding MarR family transcriptional regulator
MSRPPDLTSGSEIRLLEIFRTFDRAFLRWAKALIEAEGGTPARMRLLRALHCKGPTIMSGFREELGVTARQVTNLVDALEAEGFVRRMPHASDRRATVIELTPEGAERVSEMWNPLQDKLAEPFRQLSEADQRELLRLMEDLFAALKQCEQDGGDVPESPASDQPCPIRRLFSRRRRRPD